MCQSARTRVYSLAWCTRRGIGVCVCVCADRDFGARWHDRVGSADFRRATWNSLSAHELCQLAPAHV